jgi:hypothetical protein
MKQQTAMQEFIDLLNETLKSGLYPSTWSYSDAIAAARDIAEAMLDKEKERIIEFANSFYDDCVMEGGSLQQSAEEYYNQTYNK